MGNHEFLTSHDCVEPKLRLEWPTMKLAIRWRNRWIASRGYRRLLGKAVDSDGIDEMAELPNEEELGDELRLEDKEEPQPSKSDSQVSDTSSSGIPDCPICLQPCQHPVELPCKHVFCFLCIKGVAMQGPNGKCAICRAAIPFSVLTNPHLKDVSQLFKEPKSGNGYQWYYESRSGGWWQYDERTMQDLERAYSSNQPTCQLLLAGHLYVVDFNQMIQYRSTNRTVSRRIKRGMNLEKRGVAGIRIAGSNGGASSSGGASNGSPPPHQGSGPTTRRRRGNSSAAAPQGSSQKPATTASQSSGSSSGAGNSSQSTTGDSSQGGHISDSDDESIEEDEDYDSDYSDVDDDMELGEEEEGLIGEDSDERDTEDEEEYEARDGARAPTRRSDRSNSSNNQTPPPPGASMSGGGTGRTYSPNPNNGRGSRGAKNGRSSGGKSSSSSNNGTASRSANLGLMTDSAPLNLTTNSNTSSSTNTNTVLTSLFYNKCSIEDTVVNQINVSNNNYVDYAVSQTLSNIASTNSVKITFEKRSPQEEYL